MTTRATAGWLLVLGIGLVWCGRARAEERKFAVTPAHSPKSFANTGGLPPGGLTSIEQIRKDYFDRIDPLIDSFAEYWDEISYGDIQVTGQVFGWVTLPWAFEPNSPNSPARPSPVNFINLHSDTMLSCAGSLIELLVPFPYAYGAGEEFCDCFSVGDNETAVGLDKCGALIIIDTVGETENAPPPVRGVGLDDFPAVGVNVWTPGERFIDLDGDRRWDGIDEANDRMCHGLNGCRNVCGLWRCSGTGLPCSTDVPCPAGQQCILVSGSEQDCSDDRQECPGGETCGSDPEGSGPRGCRSLGCGDLGMPSINWTDAQPVQNCSDECVIPVLIPCAAAADCQAVDNIPVLGAAECLAFPGLEGSFCKPIECVMPSSDPEVLCNVTLPEQCDAEGQPAGCVPVGCTPGITCTTPEVGDPIMCCHFDDFDRDSVLDVAEPFEDFIVRWNPSSGSPAGAWVPVTEQYIRDNYPGDVEAVVRWTGNGYYDPPDLFVDRNNTKMIQDAGGHQFAWFLPEPGSLRGFVGASSGYATEEAWFPHFWRDWYDSDPPPWQRFSVRLRPFNPAQPNAPLEGATSNRRWFQPNAGGLDGRGCGTAEDPNILYCVGSENPQGGQTLPEEVFGYYDGWVEHDDLPSSKYHRQGDKRLGEIISPGTDTILRDGRTYTAIFGEDLGTHNPAEPNVLDDWCVAAGPYAVNIHGEKGFDAGDLGTVEWLTWRTDGESPTIGYQWEIDNGFYHPFALARSCEPRTDIFCKSDADCPADNTCSFGSLGLGFRDYNLDGMIDQGEVRPERSENYSVDSNPFTLNNGTFTDYPFNRRRLVEDIVEALDPSVDWDDFIDPNSRDANSCSHGRPTGAISAGTVVTDPKHVFEAGYSKLIPAEGFVSGIVLVPPNAYTDVNRFPTAPGYYPIHNEDNEQSEFMFPDYPQAPFDPAAVHKSFNLKFHDLVICQNCRSPSPSVTPYAAHEYLHTWEGFPDLYDYDIFTTPSIINCPIGLWDIMANGGLVHPVPPLKEQTCTAWAEAVDLTTVLTPAVETTISLPPAEFVRDSSYFFLENDDRPGERYYFWSAGSGFDERMPGQGMLILHVNDISANPEAVALQQRTPPFNFTIVEADGRGDLEACSSTGNPGDGGDIWPGTSGATRFGFDTNPRAAWTALNRWTGLTVADVDPDDNGSVAVRLSWVPTNIPSMQFVNPPSGESAGSIYQVRFQATDVHGGTTLRFYHLADQKFCTGNGATCDQDDDCPTGQLCRHRVQIASGGANFIGQLKKTSIGTSQFSVDWNLTGVADGRYVLFAKLNPGQGVDLQTEKKFSAPRPGRNNLGNGALAVNNVAIDNDGDDLDDKARLETWTVECIDAAGTQWRVNSNLTQPVLNDGSPNDDYPLASTCPQSGPCAPYMSTGGEVTFEIRAGSEPFALGDTFTFTTTGITAVSQPVTVIGGRISENPVAVIKASPLSGSPPLTVSFDARDSRDPNGEPLTFRWTFGDGTAPATASVVSHTFSQPGTYTVVLRATNTRTARFGEAQVDITVTNNSPRASFTAVPSSGRAPLEVTFDASASSDSESPANSLIYQWDFADGSGANDAGTPGVFITTKHTFRTRANGTQCTPQSTCTFNVTLTVTDPGGRSHSTTRQILVGNTVPKAEVTVSTQSGPAPLIVRFNAINSTDADGDTLTVDWTFGDGQTKLNTPLAGDDGAGNVSHTYQNPGEYTPSAVVKDGFGGQDTWTGEKIVVGQPEASSSIPRASFTIDPDPPVVNIGETIRVDAGGSVDRPIGDPNARIASYVWDFGDGSTASGVTATHAYTQAGSFRVRLTVADAETPPNTNSTSRTVTVREGPPVPPEEEGRSPTAVLAINPTEGFAGVTLFTFDARGSSDPDGDALVYRWDLGDATVVPYGAGNAVVTHTYGESGTYAVRLSVRDTTNREAATTRSVTVNPNVGNRPPQAHIGTGPRSGTAPLRLTFDGRNSFDPDGDEIELTWRIRREDGGLLGTLIGETVDWTFTEAGRYTVELVVSDGRGGFDQDGPQTVAVSAPITDEDGGQPLPDDDEEPGPVTPTGICGLGMVPMLLMTVIGLTSARRLRRTRRRTAT